MARCIGVVKPSLLITTLGKRVYTEEFRHIARMQSQMAYELSKDAYRITIRDTDEFATEFGMTDMLVTWNQVFVFCHEST